MKDNGVGALDYVGSYRKNSICTDMVSLQQNLSGCHTG